MNNSETPEGLPFWARKLAACLLNIAADEFSNHGCNDFRLRSDGGLTDEEAREAIEEMNKPDSKNYEPDEDYVPDWLLMRWIASKLERK